MLCKKEETKKPAEMILALDLRTVPPNTDVFLQRL